MFEDCLTACVQEGLSICLAFIFQSVVRTPPLDCLLSLIYILCHRENERKRKKKKNNSEYHVVYGEREKVSLLRLADQWKIKFLEKLQVRLFKGKKNKKIRTLITRAKR